MQPTIFLQRMHGILLLDEKNELHNRSMHISGMFEEVDVESTKADIERVNATAPKLKCNIRKYREVR